MACGRPFGTIDVSAHEYVSRFLEDFNNLDSELSCSVLSEDRLPDASISPLVPFQASQEFLLRVVGAFWWAFGISWGSIAVLSAALFTATVLAAYGGLRVFSSRLVAAGCALGLALSAGHIYSVVSLRDYSKAPFVVGALGLCLAIAVPPTTRAVSYTHLTLPTTPYV